MPVNPLISGALGCLKAAQGFCSCWESWCSAPPGALLHCTAQGCTARTKCICAAAGLTLRGACFLQSGTVGQWREEAHRARAKPHGAWGFFPPARRAPGCRCRGLLRSGAGCPLPRSSCVTPLLSRSVVIPARPSARGISLLFPGPGTLGARSARGARSAVCGATAAAPLRSCSTSRCCRLPPSLRSWGMRGVTCSRLWIRAMHHRGFLAHPEEHCSAVLPRIAFQMCWL